MSQFVSSMEDNGRAHSIAYGGISNDHGRPREDFSHQRCIGSAIFRDDDAFDLALVLDLDSSVESWRCLPPSLRFLGSDGSIFPYSPDFQVRCIDGSEFLIDAVRTVNRRPVDASIDYRVASDDGIFEGPCVRNARGIMSYADQPVPLSDQTRLLDLLDLVGSVTLAQATAALRSASDPLGALMALVAHRIVQVDWRSRLIGPRTCVKRYRRPRPKTSDRRQLGKPRKRMRR